MEQDDLGAPAVVSDQTLEQTEFELRKSLKVDSNSFIKSRYFQPGTRKCELLIPLCRMVALPLVRPILQTDIRRLEQDFIDGYRGGDRCFYVSLTNDQGVSKDVTPMIMETWNTSWKRRNDEFEYQVSSDPDLAFLAKKMFFVWDGNHRLHAWYPYIERHHGDEYDWHFPVEARLLVTLGHTGVLINAMNDINRYFSYYFTLYYSNAYLDSPYSPSWCHADLPNTLT